MGPKAAAAEKEEEAFKRPQVPQRGGPHASHFILALKRIVFSDRGTAAVNPPSPSPPPPPQLEGPRSDAHRSS